MGTSGRRDNQEYYQRMAFLTNIVFDSGSGELCKTTTRYGLTEYMFNYSLTTVAKTNMKALLLTADPLGNYHVSIPTSVKPN